MHGVRGTSFLALCCAVLLLAHMRASGSNADGAKASAMAMPCGKQAGQTQVQGGCTRNSPRTAPRRGSQRCQHPRHARTPTSASPGTATSLPSKCCAIWPPPTAPATAPEEESARSTAPGKCVCARCPPACHTLCLLGSRHTQMLPSTHLKAPAAAPPSSQPAAATSVSRLQRGRRRGQPHLHSSSSCSSSGSSSSTSSMRSRAVVQRRCVCVVWACMHALR